MPASAPTPSNSCCTACAASSRTAMCISSPCVAWATCSKTRTMAANPAPDRPRARRRQRPGIRFQLLILLLPGLAALLMFDSWTDYRAMARTVEVAYDETLLEVITALDEGVATDSEGAL